MLIQFRAAFFALVIAALVAAPPADRVRAQAATNQCGDPGSPYAQVQIDTQPRINLQLARTAAEQEQGLMYVTDMPRDNGMLFVYTAPSRESYWMYHTLIPLSIAFIGQDGTILNILDMPVLNDPYDMQEAGRTTYNPGVPYWYALEVNEGWFVQNGVGIGQQMVFCLGGA